MSKLKQLYWEIWEERPHECAVCGANISWPAANVFAHVYSKGAHPSLKYCKENIQLWCSTIIRTDGKVGCHEASHREVDVFNRRVRENGYQKPSLHELKSQVKATTV